MKNIISLFLILFILKADCQNTFPSSGPVGIGNNNPPSAQTLTIKSVNDGEGLMFEPPINTAFANYKMRISRSAYPAYAYEIKADYRLDINGGHQIFLVADDVFFQGNAVVTRNNINNPTSISDSKSSGTMPFEANLYKSSINAGALTYAGLQNVPSTTVEGLHRLVFKMGAVHSDLVGGAEVLNVLSNGSVGINTPDTKGYQLAVNGAGIFTKVVVKTYPWPDYVFHKSYKLPRLQEIEDYIRKHSHLPDMPSAAEVENNGVDIGGNQALLLKKLEELTLYAIDQNKRLEKQQKQIDQQRILMEKQQHQIQKLNKRGSNNKR